MLTSKKFAPLTWTLALALFSLVLPLSSAHAGNAPKFSMTGGALVPMKSGESGTLVELGFDFGNGVKGETVCYKLTTRMAGLDLPTVQADFRPYSHCGEQKSRFDRWGYGMVSVSREMRLRKDLKVTISLLGAEGEIRRGDPEKDEFFLGVVQTVLGAEFLRASGFNGSAGPDNMLGLMLNSGKVYVGFDRKLDEDTLYRFTVGLGADIGLVASDKQSLALSGDANGFARAAIILSTRANQFELFVQGTASTFGIGITPDQSDFIMDFTMGVEVRTQ